MKTLDKRIFRDFKSNLGKYLSIFILLTATIGFGSSFLSVSDSTERNLKANQTECNMEDGNFTLNSKYNFDNSGYDIQENFYVDLENDYTLRIYKNREKINKLSIFEGYIPKSKYEIAIDRAFANSNDLKINDKMTFGNDEFVIVGIISVPDYNSLFKNNSDLMMNTKDFGIGFVEEETLNDLENKYDTKYNYSFKGDTDKMKDYLVNNRLTMTSFTPKDSNQAIMFLTEDMGSDVPSMKVLIYIVVVIIAFVFVVLSSNNIENDAKSIGTLKALGCTNNEIISHYMKLPIFITLFSAIIGNILGYTILIPPFKDLYYTTYSLPPLELKLNTEAFILTTVIPIIIMVLINFFMLRKKLNLKTIKFLRKDIRKTKNKNIKLSKKLSFKSRFKIRTIFDNIGNFIILFFGIFLASLILLFSIGLDPVIKNYEDMVRDTAVSEYQYILNTPIETDSYKLTQYSMKTFYEKGNKDVVINFMGLSDNKEFFDDLKLHNLDEGVVISDSFALKMGIEIGDEVEFKDENTNKNYKYKVLDIYEYKTAYAVFVKQKDLNKLIDLPENYFNSILSNKELTIDQKFIVKQISRDDISNIASQMLTSFEGTIKMIIIFSVIIYLVLMYVLTKVIVEKNALNISLMKVLGYNNKEIKNLFLRGPAIAVIIILFLVLPLESISIDFVMDFATSMLDGYFELNIPLYIYAEVVAVGIVTYFVINKFHIQKINKIPMEDALKDRE